MISLTKLAQVKARGALNVNAVSFVDESGSMTWGCGPKETGESRWSVSRKINAAVTAEVCKFDNDGIDLVFFNDRYKVHTGVTEAAVQGIFAQHTPGSGTALAAPLQAMIDKYLPAKLIAAAKPGGMFKKATPAVYDKISPEKPVAFLVWTDGSPSDREAVEAVIIDASQRIKKDADFGIAIIQVGHDASAAAWLKTLDVGLVAKGAAFDVVAVVHFDEIAANGLSAEDTVRLAFTG